MDVGRDRVKVKGDPKDFGLPPGKMEVPMPEGEVGLGSLAGGVGTSRVRVEVRPGSVVGT